MAWTKTRYNGHPAAWEDLTLPTGAATDVVSSPIDFIPKGVSQFTVFANAGATNLASAAAVDIQASELGVGGPFFTMEADLVAAIDNAQGVAKVDYVNDAAHVPFPVYRLLIDSAGNQTGEVVRNIITWNEEEVN